MDFYPRHERYRESERKRLKHLQRNHLMVTQGGWTKDKGQRTKDPMTAQPNDPMTQ